MIEAIPAARLRFGDMLLPNRPSLPFPRNTASAAPVARPALQQVDDHISAEAAHAPLAVLPQDRERTSCNSGIRMEQHFSTQERKHVRVAMEVRNKS